MSMTVDEFRDNTPVYTKGEKKELEKKLKNIKEIREKASEIEIKKDVTPNSLRVKFKLPTKIQKTTETESENKLTIDFVNKLRVASPNNNKLVKEMTKEEFAQTLRDNIPFYPRKTIEKIKDKIDYFGGIYYNKSTIYNDIKFVTLEIGSEGFTMNFFIPDDNEYTCKINPEDSYIEYKVSINSLKETVEKNDSKFPKLNSSNQVKIFYNPYSKRQTIFEKTLKGISSAVKKAGFAPIEIPTTNVDHIEIDDVSISKDTVINAVKSFYENNFADNSNRFYVKKFFQDIGVI